jgi:hypothetical protein
MGFSRATSAFSRLCIRCGKLDIEVVQIGEFLAGFARKIAFF